MNREYIISVDVVMALIGAVAGTDDVRIAGFGQLMHLEVNGERVGEFFYIRPNDGAPMPVYTH